MKRLISTLVIVLMASMLMADSPNVDDLTVYLKVGVINKAKFTSVVYETGELDEVAGVTDDKITLTESEGSREYTYSGNVFASVQTNSPNATYKLYGTALTLQNGSTGYVKDAPVIELTVNYTANESGEGITAKTGTKTFKTAADATTVYSGREFVELLYNSKLNAGMKRLSWKLDFETPENVEVQAGEYEALLTLEVSGS